MCHYTQYTVGLEIFAGMKILKMDRENIFRKIFLPSHVYVATGHARAPRNTYMWHGSTASLALIAV